MKKLSLFKITKTDHFEHNRFMVYIEASHTCCFQIKYPRKDYSPRIDECTSLKWERHLMVIKSKPLFLEVFLSNPTAVKGLQCTLKIDELNSDDEVIQSHSFSFTAGTKLEQWKWQKFEVKSIVDYD